jgi:hypothetical protein
VALSIAALATALGAGFDAGAGNGAHVRLRGGARIEAQGVRAEGQEMLLRGSLTDDGGAPLGGGTLSLSIARAADPSRPLSPGSPTPGRGLPRTCGTGQTPHVDGDGTLQIAIDDAGRFCVRVPLPIERYLVHLVYAGSAYVDAVSLDAVVDLSRRACSLTFSPEPRVLPLDSKVITVDATATLESDGATAPGAGLALTLTTERSSAPVATATTDRAGHARFVLEPAQLGPPGRGEIRLAFAGNADAAGATRVVSVERHAHVLLDVPGAPHGELGGGSPEDGVAIVVTARAAGGEVASGSVEARVNDAIVGAAPVEAGSASLLVTFALPESSLAASEVSVVLRYVPSNPWFEPGVESTWRLPVRGRSPLRQLPLVLAGLGVAAWFAMTRAQRARALAKVTPRARLVSRGEAKIDVLSVARHASEGWRGRAIDADDGAGIAAARVQIERPAFGRAEVLGSVLTGPDGRFVLATVDLRPGDELAIEAPLHVPLRRPLPPAGELDAQLVQRRRALLGRLVTWARQRGRPFDARPEPTPGHVRHAAGDDFPVARWADAVERAAYGGEPVDAHVEADVDRLAPPPAHAPAPRLDPHALAHPTKPNR